MAAPMYVSIIRDLVKVNPVDDVDGCAFCGADPEWDDPGQPSYAKHDYHCAWWAAVTAIGYDPWLHTVQTREEAQDAIQQVLGDVPESPPLPEGTEGLAVAFGNMLDEAIGINKTACPDCFGTGNRHGSDGTPWRCGCGAGRFHMVDCGLTIPECETCHGTGLVDVTADA